MMNLLSGVHDDNLTLELVNAHGDFSRLSEEFTLWGDISLEKMADPGFLQHITGSSYAALPEAAKSTVLAHMLK